MDAPNSQDQNIALPQPADPSVPAPLPVDVRPAPQQASRPAADMDEIELAWVSQVEQIFHAYADDPYMLSAQLSETRAEYIAQRYGISVKKADGQA